MRAVVLEKSGLVFRTDYPEPTLCEGEVLVRVLRAGICETDLQLIRGYLGFRGVLGHEFVGVAETGRWKGRRVVCEINCSCHRCSTCQSGLPNHCPNRTVLGIVNRDGCFADLVAVPERNLHAVPEEVSTDEAVFAEPLAAAFEILAQVSFHPKDRVVVLGDGRLGHLCAQVLKQTGADVLVVGKHAEKLKLLEQEAIATGLADQLSPSRVADLVVDCTGSPSGLEQGLKWLKPRGTLVLKTTLAASHTLSLAPVVIDEITIVGSRCGPFRPALDALAEKRVNVRPLISAVLPLEQALEAFQHAQSSTALKVLLAVDE
ncbi:MAG: alcohol dehydrogenase catalytic domain-containing protein [Planctomycetes bacterium]|nr:alcohol dehydrogenase catalytic domain-containing protein [Planctomycetota bacterium]